MSETNGHLTKGDLVNIHQALVALENPVPFTVEGKETKQPYSLGEKAKYAILRNMRKIKGLVEDIDKEREELRQTYNPRRLQPRELTDQAAREWDQMYIKLMAEKAEGVKFHTVNLDEFQVPKNSTLPLSVIATLMDVVINDNAPQDAVKE